jgi:hypothetical protein
MKIDIKGEKFGTLTEARVRNWLNRGYSIPFCLEEGDSKIVYFPIGFVSHDGDDVVLKCLVFIDGHPCPAFEMISLPHLIKGLLDVSSITLERKK